MEIMKRKEVKALGLKGTIVSELHCASNWQLLTASDNCSKKNKFEQE